MADPVAEKSGFLKMYMSNHPDTLVAYAKWYGKVKEQISSAEMSAIDTKGMTLTCTLKNGTKKEVRVPLDPPLSGYEEVKPRLLEMKALAQEGLGMIKAPHIKSFAFPKDAIGTGLFVASLLYVTFTPTNPTSLVFAPATFLRSHINQGFFSVTFWSIFILHIFESIYTFSLCWRHSTGLAVGAQYVISTMIFGFPIWKSLRRRIQSARIDSVMKVE